MELFPVICGRVQKSALIDPCLHQSSLDVIGAKNKLYEAPAWSIWSMHVCKEIHVGLFGFIKEAGEKLFGAKEVE